MYQIKLELILYRLINSSVCTDYTEGKIKCVPQFQNQTKPDALFFLWLTEN